MDEQVVRKLYRGDTEAVAKRLACCLGTENGIQICAPVHDAVLIASPAERLGSDVTQMRLYMEQASAIVLDGFKLRTEAKLVYYPCQYSDPRGEKMWCTVRRLL